MANSERLREPGRARRHRLGGGTRRRRRYSPGRGRRRHHRLRHRPHPRRGRLELAASICSSDPVRDIPTEEEWEALLSRSGIGNDTTVVLYGDNNNWFAAFAYWLFKLYGHDDVCLMNGGRAKWIAEGRALTTDVPTVTRHHLPGRANPTRGCAPSATRSPPPSADAARRWSTCARRRSTPASCWRRRTCRRKARSAAATSPARRTSPGPPPSPRTAPSSRPPSCAPSTAARASPPDKPTIAYCRIGERSAHTWFVLTELLGYPNVRNYDGSWTEWGSLIGAPIER